MKDGTTETLRSDEMAATTTVKTAQAAIEQAYQAIVTDQRLMDNAMSEQDFAEISWLLADIAEAGKKRCAARGNRGSLEYVVEDAIQNLRNEANF
jgi:hypothetical protein